ncbi:MAG TPA: YafY family protein [Ktedonobacterales bacterium]|jgi:predicted DNA-binding transcriptional regulator YafY
MNRTDRLLAIVLELQARRWARAEDLAATFEVTRRTIYRDMLALGESGVPVVSVPGRGYSLVEGYFLPPLTFTTDEAVMLLLGAGFVGRQFDEQYRDAARAAAHKIVAVLPEPRRREVANLESRIQFVAGNGRLATATLQRVRQAIIERRTLRFRYHARHHDDGQAEDGQASAPKPPDPRAADPYALVHVNGAWIMVGWCHLRQADRRFRLDRMDDVALLDATFTPPAGFTLARAPEEDRTLLIRALFDHETARWVDETPSYFQVGREERADGVVVTLAVRQPGEVLHWLLGWGARLRVLEPESVRALVARETQSMLARHQPIAD